MGGANAVLPDDGGEAVQHEGADMSLGAWILKDTVCNVQSVHHARLGRYEAGVVRRRLREVACHGWCRPGACTSSWVDILACAASVECLGKL